MHKSLFVTLLLSASLFAQTAAKPAAPPSSHLPTEATVNEFLRHTFGYDQNLKWTITKIEPAPDPALSQVTVQMNTPQGQQSVKLFVTPDQKFAISGDFLPFGADPYAPMRNLLDEKAKGPSRGAANPTVTIVEFGDLQCPACKRAQPIIEKLMGDEPNAKLIFQQYPLTTLHKWAEIAAKYALCVDRQNKEAFWKFVDTVYQNQDDMQAMSVEQVEPKLKQYAGDSGVNADQVQKCTSEPSITSEVVTSQALGQQVEVTGTPTLFIGGRKIGNVAGVPYDTLKSIAEFQAGNK
jgi:protein-disulfide isomerase